MSVICLHPVKGSNSLTQPKSFVCTEFKCQSVLFDPKEGPGQKYPKTFKISPFCTVFNITSKNLLSGNLKQ